MLIGLLSACGAVTVDEGPGTDDGICGEDSDFCSPKCGSLKTTDNCGRCGNACETDQICIPVIENNNPTYQCGCEAGFKTCQGDKLNCQNNLNTSHKHCGGCYESCDASAECRDGKCVCPTLQDGLTLENDPKNCGTCGYDCTNNFNTACEDSRCTCGDGTTTCNIAEGKCNIDLSSDANHCKKCEIACPPKSGGQTAAECTGDACTGECVDGTCQCDEGFQLCETDKEYELICVSKTDKNHCGDCNTQCPGNTICVEDTSSTSGYSCKCPEGTQNCGNEDAPVCVDTDTDIRHCGGCNEVCPTDSSFIFEPEPGGLGNGTPHPISGFQPLQSAPVIPVCTAGKCGFGCSQDDYRTCAAGPKGMGLVCCSDDVSCGAVNFIATGCGVCKDDDVRCNSDVPEKCIRGYWKTTSIGDVCTGLIEIATQVWACQDSECRPTCRPEFQTCKEGTADEPAICCENDVSCKTDGSCGECLDGAKLCFDGTLIQAHTKTCRNGIYGNPSNCRIQSIPHGKPTCNATHTACDTGCDDGYRKCVDFRDESITCCIDSVSCTRTGQCGECLDGAKRCVADPPGVQTCVLGQYAPAEHCSRPEDHHVNASCEDGSCKFECKPTHGDCNHDIDNPNGDGCETQLGTSQNCMGCGQKCSPPLLHCEGLYSSETGLIRYECH